MAKPDVDPKTEVDYAEHGDYELVLLGERLDAMRQEAEKLGFMFIAVVARQDYGGPREQAICFVSTPTTNPERMRAFWTMLLSAVHMSGLSEGTMNNVKLFQKILARRLANSDGDSLQLK